ncbi:sphingolipid delta-4 desaturase [Entomophthora muscae]|uniref:Sphingolipid delta-4 desaturase n=1 Tax=Entomophthora muscae TaxID=34485 RepID=A0ACC2TV81_9FUNG|nr:sphingolipid delta-4 desaturase [Entomophthora muscae]
MTPQVESKGFDSRHPLYKGDWKKSVPYVDNGMATDNMDEPHVKRKHAILSKYPQIQELYGTDTLTIHVILASTAAQMFMAYLFGQVLVNWNWTMVLCSYFIGGSLTSLYGCIIHELCHNLAHPSPFVKESLPWLSTRACLCRWLPPSGGTISSTMPIWGWREETLTCRWSGSTAWSRATGR